MGLWHALGEAHLLPIELCEFVGELLSLSLEEPLNKGYQ
jgi:hypothetical protein